MEGDNIYDSRVSQIKKQLKGLGTSPYTGSTPIKR